MSFKEALKYIAYTDKIWKDYNCRILKIMVQHMNWELKEKGEHGAIQIWSGLYVKNCFIIFMAYIVWYLS